MSLVGTDVEEAVQGFGVVKGRVTAEDAGNISVQWPDGEISQMPLRRLQRLNERTATREQATVELQQTEAAAEQVAADMATSIQESSLCAAHKVDEIGANNADGDDVKVIKDVCTVCGLNDHADLILKCGESSCGCGAMYHMYCLTPCVLDPPDAGQWFCPRCEAKGLKAEKTVGDFGCRRGVSSYSRHQKVKELAMRMTLRREEDAKQMKVNVVIRRLALQVRPPVTPHIAQLHCH